MNRILAIFALIVFGGFLFILVYEVPRVDLILIIGFTAALAVFDFIRTLRKKRD